jgi:hypothetical protein
VGTMGVLKLPQAHCRKGPPQGLIRKYLPSSSIRNDKYWISLVCFVKKMPLQIIKHLNSVILYNCMRIYLHAYGKI